MIRTLTQSVAIQQDENNKFQHYRIRFHLADNTSDAHFIYVVWFIAIHWSLCDGMHSFSCSRYNRNRKYV